MLEFHSSGSVWQFHLLDDSIKNAPEFPETEILEHD